MRISNWKALIIITVSFSASMAVLSGHYALSDSSNGSAISAEGILDEDGPRGRINRVVKPGRINSTLQSLGIIGSTNMLAAAPLGDANAGVTGVFGAPVTWPIIAIHMVLLPDGRVMSYGTNQKAAQGAAFVYDVWDPALGTADASHMVLPNTTGTNIFCAAQTLTANGDVFISGGTYQPPGSISQSIDDTTIFTPTTDTIASGTPMHYPRWYGSLVALPNNNLVIFGGKQNTETATPVIPATTPEAYDPGTKTWHDLTGATSDAAFGVSGSGWFYPRAFAAPGGTIFVLAHNGNMYSVSYSGAGNITQLPTKTLGTSAALPTILFAPGKALSLRNRQAVMVIDFSRPTPTVTQTDNIDQVRLWASGTVMADGKVLVTGGSTVSNDLATADYQAEIWDPATGHWTAGAKATIARLYHSNALLLADGSVVTAGGGAPGPLANLNAEIYYPPYLYANDSSGNPAVRPVISSVTPQALKPGDALTVVMETTHPVLRITFVRTGSPTHSSNLDQRFFDLPFSQSGRRVSIVLPSDQTVLLPGNYMLFAFNRRGVPSISSAVTVTVPQT